MTAFVMFMVVLCVTVLFLLFTIMMNKLFNVVCHFPGLFFLPISNQIIVFLL